MERYCFPDAWAYLALIGGGAAMGVIAAELKLHNSALDPARARPLLSSYFITMTVLVSQRHIMRRINVP